MPRITVLSFTKDYETVADAFAGMVKNAVITRRTDDDRNFIDVEGDFSHFVLDDLDMWEGHLKFEIQDNRLQGEDDREARIFLLSAEPRMAETLFSPTIAHVYRRTEYRTRTTTIVERLEGERATMTEREVDKRVEMSDPQYEWVEITREFGQKVKIEG